MYKAFNIGVVPQDLLAVTSHFSCTIAMVVALLLMKAAQLFPSSFVYWRRTPELWGGGSDMRRLGLTTFREPPTGLTNM